MLKNLFVGTEKFVLFIDLNGYERVGNKIIEKCVKDDIPYLYVPKLNTVEIEYDSDIKEKSNIILKPISKISQHYEIPEIIKLIHRIKKNRNVKQIFGWLTISNVLDDRITTYLEHMADLVVTLKDSQYLSVLTKKASGSISKKVYQYEINGNLDVNVSLTKKEAIEESTNEPEVNPQNLTTFKINFDEEELVARNAVKLPYEKTHDKEKHSESKILYQPDSDDDFDEEDPDEDLYI